jgi:hypothetical protein
VTAKFVIGLPAGDMGVASVSLRHCRGDTFGLSEIGLARKVIVPPRPEAACDAGVNINWQDFGILHAQPFGRGRGRSSQNDFQSSRTQGFNSTIHPLPRERALAPLDPAPGKLANADIGQAKVAHPLRIAGPVVFGPMFRIITDA